MNRRACLLMMAAPVLPMIASAGSQGQKPEAQSGQAGSPTPLKDSGAPQDWVCPMDPDVRSDKPGTCPRCGMKLALHIPERVEYRLVMSHAPAAVRKNEPVTLTFRVLDPRSGEL